MGGGADNDLYTVDDTGDTIVENLNEGTDTVSSSVTFTLSDNVETLVLTGTTAIDATGNGIANTLTGNSAANVLSGEGGIDTLSGKEGGDTLWGGAGNDKLDGGTGGDAMAGGADNDVFTVDDAGDAVIENLNEGTDTVNSSVTFTLPDNVEKLGLTGTGAIDGTGNALDNTLNGNTASNTLAGLDGKDTLSGGTGEDLLIGGLAADVLTGGAGADAFRFDVLETTANRDLVKDFVHGTDEIQISRAAFTAFAGDPAGAVDAANFKLGTAATSVDHHLIYDQATGGLFYDSDGIGAAAQVQIASLTTKPILDAGDFVLI